MFATAHTGEITGTSREVSVSNKHDLVGVAFPNGVKNVEYGVWRSRCCGQEVVLYPGLIFPTCNKHPDSVTEWVLISTDLLRKSNVAQAGSAPRRLKNEGHISRDRLQELSTGGVLPSEPECAHLTNCFVCRFTRERFALDHLDRLDHNRPKSA